MRRKCREKKGAALLVAVFLMLLLLVLSVSLLLGAYSLTHTMQGERQSMQTKELAKTFSTGLERELTEVQFADAAAEEAARSAGEDALWFYLKDQIGQGSWQVQTERTFAIGGENVTEETAEQLLEQSQVAMQWKELSDGTIELSVTVTAQSGKESSEITTVYTLKREPYEGEEENERWSWRFAERR